MIGTMRAFAAAATSTTTGGAFISRGYRRPKKPTELQQWLHDRSLGGVCQHEARAHMASDLARYLFSASFAHLWGYRSEEHTSELQSLMRILYAVFCLKKKNND